MTTLTREALDVLDDRLNDANQRAKLALDDLDFEARTEGQKRILEFLKRERHMALFAAHSDPEQFGRMVDVARAAEVLADDWERSR